jgi:hypothetical protein
VEGSGTYGRLIVRYDDTCNSPWEVYEWEERFVVRTVEMEHINQRIWENQGIGAEKLVPEMAFRREENSVYEWGNLTENITRKVQFRIKCTQHQSSHCPGS